MELLAELLNQYSGNGIPSMPGLLSFQSPSNETNGDPFQLEEHWSRFVDNVQNLSKRTQNQQDAIWELLETEVFFIRRLKIITDLFIACLCNLQNECILNEIDTEKMFSNISEVFRANQEFWHEHLAPMLNASRNSGRPLDPTFMSQGFLMFEQIFHPYIKYCSDHIICLQYVKEKHKSSDLFKTYVAWCETQKDCERLRLTDLLVKPMQRLTKYSLLLKAIHKKTDDDQHKKCLISMNECVEKFVCDVDGILRKRHELERLSSIINKIESYNVVETSNDDLLKVVKDYNSLDLTCPMPQCGTQLSRELLLEGSSLKLRDLGTSGKIDVYCFLFTDMLLICKSINKKGDRVRIIRQPYIVDRLLVAEIKDGGGLSLVYVNEYKVATAAFLLYTTDAKLWLDGFRKAQDQFQEAKNSSSSTEKQFGYLNAIEGDEDEYYFPSTALLVARSARSSSRCSLAHSRSGSVEINDQQLPPPPPPTHLPVSPVANRRLQYRTASVELSDFRQASVSSEEGPSEEASRGGRTPKMAGSTSPRPERRAFLLKGSGASLNVHTIPTRVNEEDLLPPPSIQVPASPSRSVSPMRSPLLSPRGVLQRSMSGCSNKHPLVKMRQSSVTHSAPASKGPSPIGSFDADSLIVEITPSDRVHSEGDVPALRIHQQNDIGESSYSTDLHIKPSCRKRETTNIKIDISEVSEPIKSPPGTSYNYNEQVEKMLNNPLLKTSEV